MPTNTTGTAGLESPTIHSQPAGSKTRQPTQSRPEKISVAASQATSTSNVRLNNLSPMESFTEHAHEEFHKYVRDNPILR